MVKRNPKFQILLEEYVNQGYTAIEAYEKYLTYKERSGFNHVITKPSFYNALYKVRQQKKPQIKTPPFLMQQKRPFNLNEADHYEIDFKIFGITVFTKKIRA